LIWTIGRWFVYRLSIGNAHMIRNVGEAPVTMESSRS